MQKRTAQLAALVIIIMCSCDGVASAQRRRAASRERRAPLLVPLMPEQKEAVGELVRQAKEVDYDYKFQRRKDLWAKAGAMWGRSRGVAELLPEGDLKNLVLATGHAYQDAAIIWCGYTDHLGYYTQEDLMHVIERHRWQDMTPYAMVATAFGAASMLKDALSAALAKSPTARRAQSSNLPDRSLPEGNTALDTVAITPADTPHPVPEIKCTVGVAQAPELRGFRLGMSFDQGVARFPGLNFFPKDVGPGAPILREIKLPDPLDQMLMELKFLRFHDYAGADIQNTTNLESVKHSTVRAALNTKRFQEFEGVDWVKVKFVGGRITSVRLEYDETVKQGTPDEFFRRTIEVLGLPGTWHLDETNARQFLKCEGFSASIGFDYEQAFVELRDLGRVGMDMLPSQSQTSSAKSDGASPSADSGDWSFPKQGMQGRYSEDIKGMIYDLGDSIHAAHMKLEGMPIVMIIFAEPVPQDVMSDADLACLAAYKAANLRLSGSKADLVLERENNYEHRFRAASSKVIGVTLSRDRKTALLRLHPDQ